MKGTCSRERVPGRGARGRTCAVWVLIGGSALAVAGLWSDPAPAQVSFSINYQGPTIAAPDLFFGIPITEGDILSSVLVPAPPPFLVHSGGFIPVPGLGLPLHPAAVGHPPGVPGFVEVDALSYGTDALLDPAALKRGWVFSVDQFAQGIFPPPPVPPNLTTEGALGFAEASADVFSFFFPSAMPPAALPVPPFAVPPGNLDLLDGDGLGPIGPFALGLFEPNIPVPGPLRFGDDLDALDLETPALPAPGIFPVFYSLDSGPAVFDFIKGIPGSGSAAANGPFSGADILVTFAPGGPPAIFAPAAALGLDVAGVETDDVDALVLVENGTGVYEPWAVLFDWVGGASDMLLFSVRRGSAIIGTPDLFFGIAISEGDVLIGPPAGSPPGTPPGILVAGENLGLCIFRPPPFPPPPCPIPPWGPFSDDLNALDVVLDCDDDAFPDVIAILLGISPDVNGDGIPDPCQCLEDVNRDGAVNVLDLVALLLCFGSPAVPLCVQEDINADGVVNVLDLIAILLAFGTACPSPC